ncbi:MAG: hypothetical protein WC831_04865 [Parcubacteria group bacterium]|jgi:hypothetical protein
MIEDGSGFENKDIGYRAEIRLRFVKELAWKLQSAKICFDALERKPHDESLRADLENRRKEFAEAVDRFIEEERSRPTVKINAASLSKLKEYCEFSWEEGERLKELMRNVSEMAN